MLSQPLELTKNATVSDDIKEFWKRKNLLQLNSFLQSMQREINAFEDITRPRKNKFLYCLLFTCFSDLAT